MVLAGVFQALLCHGVFSSAQAGSPHQAHGGAGPTGTACAALAYISNTCSYNVSVIDTSNNTVVATVPMIGLSPEGVAVNPAGTRVYVTNPAGNNPNINVIDTSSNTVVAVISLMGFPHGLAVKPDGSRVYVTSNGLPSALGN